MLYAKEAKGSLQGQHGFGFLGIAIPYHNTVWSHRSFICLCTYKFSLFGKMSRLQLPENSFTTNHYPINSCLSKTVSYHRTIHMPVISLFSISHPRGASENKRKRK